MTRSKEYKLLKNEGEKLFRGYNLKCSRVASAYKAFSPPLAKTEHQGQFWHSRSEIYGLTCIKARASQKGEAELKKCRVKVRQFLPAAFKMEK